MAGKRIVSLIASSTEIVCALGFENRLVGISHECDYPDSIRNLPVCTAPKFNPVGASREVDARVKSLLREALSVYRVEEKILRDLSPDLIVTQAQCEVCAVSLRDVEETVRGWIDSRPQIVSLEPDGLPNIWEDIRKVANSLEAPEAGDELVGRLRARMEAVSKKTSALSERPTVACIEWIDPLMAAGNWMPDLVEMAGGVNLFGLAGAHAPDLRWEEVKRKDPGVIVIMPCGFGLSRTREEMAPLTDRPDWEDLRAVREGRVYLTDGNQFFNRPGPRLVESLEILAEILHPSAFEPAFEGTGWECL